MYQQSNGVVRLTVLSLRINLDSMAPEAADFLWETRRNKDTKVGDKPMREE